jgi:TolB-like protein
MSESFWGSTDERVRLGIAARGLMSEIFLSYARPDETEAKRIAEALRAHGWGVWRDDELPPHRPYAEVIEERLRSAKAVVVLWTIDAAKSQWVRAEADVGRERGTLVQLTLDGSIPPLPFNQIQCADLRGWEGEESHPAWIKITGGVSDLLGSDSASVMVPQAPPSEPHVFPTAKPVVSIRPFTMAAGADADGLAAGLTEEIRNALSRHSMIGVAAARKGVATDDYLLEGSVQQAGERLRVSAKLVASDGGQVWSDRYDGSRADVFELQDRVALAVASNVESAIRTLEIERAIAAPEDAFNARQLFYRALKQILRFDREGLADARRLLDRVLELEPDHLHALALMAQACGAARWSGFYEDGEEGELVRRGVSCAQHALQLSDVDPYSTGLAAVSLASFGHAIDAVLSLVERVLSLSPSFAFGWVWSGTAYLIAGDPERALSQLHRALELDPRMRSRAATLYSIGAALILLERFDEAHGALAESIQIRSHFPPSRMYLALCQARMGRLDEAHASLAAAEALTPVSRIRGTFRDPDQRRRLREGLALAGFDKAELVFPDVA